MRIGILSDSHGNIDNVRGTVKKLIDKYKIKIIIHLGDECEDTEILKEFEEVELIQVPGVFCEHYQNPKIPNRIIKKFNGIKVLITHSSSHSNDPPEELKPEELIEKKK